MARTDRDSSDTTISAQEQREETYQDMGDALEQPDIEGKTIPAAPLGDDAEENTESDDRDTNEPGTEDDTGEGNGLLEDSAEPAADKKASAVQAAALPDDAVLFTVDAPDGTTTAVTKLEAKRGWLREADYTRKTMALADVRKQATAEKETYASLVQTYSAHLTKIKEPDWDALKVQGNEAYLIARDEWRAVKEEEAAVEAEKQRLSRERDADAQANMAQFHADESQKLLVALPHWKEQDVAAREVKLIQADMLSRGFGDDFLSKLTAKEILVVRDAVLYRQLKSKAKTKQAPPASKSLRPGTTTTKAPATKAAARFKQTGRLRDAGDAFAEEIFGGK